MEARTSASFRQSLSFKTQVAVCPVLHINDYDEEERRASFYSNSDIKEFKTDYELNVVRSIEVKNRDEQKEAFYRDFQNAKTQRTKKIKREEILAKFKHSHHSNEFSIASFFGELPSKSMFFLVSLLCVANLSIRIIKFD